MDNLLFSPFIIAALSAGIIEVSKKAGLNPKYAGLASLWIGLLFGLIYALLDITTPLLYGIIGGIMGGLMASGAYSGTKSVIQK